MAHTSQQEELALTLVKEYVASFLTQALLKKITTAWSTWVAQPVKCKTLDFGSGGDPGVMRLSATSGSALGVEHA